MNSNLLNPFITIPIFAIILILFAFKAYKRGFLSSATLYLSYIVAYILSILFTFKLGDIIGKIFPIEGLAIYFVAALVIFFGATSITNFIFKKIVDRFFWQQSDPEEVSKASRIGGLALGLSMGIFVGLLMVYIVNFTQKLYIATNDLTAQSQNIESESDSTISANETPVNVYTPVPSEDKQIVYQKTLYSKEPFINSIADKVVNNTGSFIVEHTSSNNKPSGEIAKEILKNPAEVIGNVKKIASDPNIIDALTDPEIEKLLKNGDSAALLKQEKFNLLLENPAIKTTLGNNISDEEKAKAVIAIWQKAESLKNNPRVMEIISDPVFMREMNSGNPLLLIQNPKLKELLDIVSRQ